MAEGMALRVAPAGRVEALFRSDATWLGGDGAGSVELEGGNRLWLFGDTFVASEPDGSRATATLVHNTVAVQRAEPTGPDMAFRWCRDDDGSPRDVFTDPAPGCYIWPGHAVLVGGRLLVFLMRIRPRAAGRIPALTNFAVVGWSAVIVDDPSRDPLDWTPHPVARSETPGVALVGSGGVFVDGDHLYAHAVSRRTTLGRRHLLARWPVDAATEGDLSQPTWWCGRRGWRRGVDASPTPVARPALTEFTVHRDPATGRLLRVELVGLHRPRLRVRWTDRPQGPWSRPRRVLRPPQAEEREVFCYAAKAHPGLAAGDDRLVVTYNSNTRDVASLVARDDLYRPHAFRVDLR